MKLKHSKTGKYVAGYYPSPRTGTYYPEYTSDINKAWTFPNQESTKWYCGLVEFSGHFIEC